VRSSRKRAVHALVLALAIAATVALCYLALAGVHPARAWTVLKQSDLWWLVPGTLAMIAGVVARAVRWRGLFHPSTRPPFGPVIETLVLSCLLNAILPARAGDAARVVALKRRAAVSQAETLGTLVLERGYDLFAVVVLFLAATPWLPNTHWGKAAEVLAGVLAVGGVATAVVISVYGARPIAFALRPLTRLPRVSPEQVTRGAENLTRGLSALRDGRLALAAAAWSIVAWLLTGLSCWFVMLGFHFGLSPMAGMLVAIAIALALILPAPPGALGVFEAAVVLAMGAYGVNASEALSYGIAVHVINVVPYVVVAPGLLYLEVRRGRRAGGSEAAAPLRARASVPAGE
jgi:uncharacterized protein (TIRG00374 family)